MWRDKHIEESGVREYIEESDVRELREKVVMELKREMRMEWSFLIEGNFFILMESRFKIMTIHFVVAKWTPLKDVVSSNAQNFV